MIHPMDWDEDTAQHLPTHARFFRPSVEIRTSEKGRKKKGIRDPNFLRDVSPEFADEEVDDLIVQPAPSIV